MTGGEAGPSEGPEASAPDVGGALGLARNAAVGAPVMEHVRVRPEAERYWRALKDVLDPELPISLVDMGLIYDIRVAGPADGSGPVELEVVMTFTATACPCMELITMDIRDRLQKEAEVRSVAIEVVWDPPWTRSMITEEGRARLRKYGVAA